jgi:hypothetical protein
MPPITRLLDQPQPDFVRIPSGSPRDGAPQVAELIGIRRRLVSQHLKLDDFWNAAHSGGKQVASSSFP